MRGVERAMAEAARTFGWLRPAVLVIGAVELGLLALLASTSIAGFASSEQLGRSISGAVLTVAGVLAVPVLLAVLLALFRRWLWLALALEVLALAAPLFAFPRM